MRKISLILALLMILSSFVACTDNGGAGTESETTAEDETILIEPINDNYRTFYQIFVGSFSDSDGDGIGDIRGIINRFDYLNDGNMGSSKSLGVEGIWLSPIFKSPSYHKYDAMNYYEIDWRFGKEADLKELIALCNERNVKLILDIAINHTSSFHDWFAYFKEARIKGDTENEYYDFYSCVKTDEKQGGITYQEINGTDFWYECNFSGDMPELNYDNEKVREEALNIAKYYLELGVHGFRFDAVKYIYLNDTKKSVDFWQWYMSELRKLSPDIYCVGECWSGEAEILEYYGAMNCFNFAMAQAEGAVAKAAKGFSLSTYTGYVEDFQKAVLDKNQDGMVIPFLSNHDMDRIAGAFIGEKNMKMAANLYLLSPGSPIIYYGEEIGLRGSRGSANTDANRRLAMMWGDGDTVKNPTGATYPEKNQIKTTVKDQKSDENSMLNYYSKLLLIRRKYPEIARGVYKSISCDDNLGGFAIEYKGESTVIIHNTASEEMTAEVGKYIDLTDPELCDVIGTSSASFENGVLTIGAQTSVILKKIPA